MVAANRRLCQVAEACGCAWRIVKFRRLLVFGTSLGNASASGTIREQPVTQLQPPALAGVLPAQYEFDSRCRNVETHLTLLPDQLSSRTRRGRDTHVESYRSV